MIIIKSKCGSIFQGMNEDYMDAEMKLSMAYYKAQGCTVEYVDSFKFGDECNCEDLSKKVRRRHVSLFLRTKE